jgi:hypothetical protein
MEVNKTASSASSAMPVSPEILPVLAIFENAFTAPTWEKAQTLIVGTLLVRCRREIVSEREIRDPASYLYRIAMTATLDAVRRIKAKREEQLRLVEDEYEDEGAPLALSSDPNRSPEVEARRKQLAGKVRTALARLSDNRRRGEASVLRRFDYPY